MSAEPRRSYRSNGQARPGSQRLSSDEYAPAQASPQPARQAPRPSVKNSASSAGTSASVSSSTGPTPIEEGDFVWVSDESGVCTSAVVVRTGFLFDEDSDQEQHVTVVHTEDGEERAIRGRPLVKLPAYHHPKQLLPLELHDLSNVPLMATNVRDSSWVSVLRSLIVFNCYFSWFSYFICRAMQAEPRLSRPSSWRM